MCKAREGVKAGTGPIETPPLAVHLPHGENGASLASVLYSSSRFTGGHMSKRDWNLRILRSPLFLSGHRLRLGVEPERGGGIIHCALLRAPGEVGADPHSGPIRGDVVDILPNGRLARLARSRSCATVLA